MMLNNTYEKIDNELKQSDYARQINSMDFVTFSLLLIVAMTTTGILFVNKILAIGIFIGLSLSIVLIEYAILFRALHNVSRRTMYLDCASRKDLQAVSILKKSDFFRVHKILKLQRIIKNTLPSLRKILKANGITNNEGRNEYLSHIRIVTQSLGDSHNGLPTLITLGVSILSILLMNVEMSFRESLFAVGIISALIAMFYFSFLFVKYLFLKAYGKKAFYMKIEAALSEMQAKSKNTVRKKKSNNSND